MPENRWDTNLYESKHAFVWQNASDVVELLSPVPGERILDLGCGTGQLTAKIALAECEVLGIDRDAAMIEKARQNYPHLSFAIADARDFQVEGQFDAVFSNAVLHWIPESDAPVRSVYTALKQGGRFVAEFGGKGNIGAIALALTNVLDTLGYASCAISPWYFPSIAQYATVLEQQGFDVTYAVLLDRPTPLEGDAGMRNWIEMFASRFLEKLSSQQQTEVIQAIEHQLKPTLYRDGKWWADYRRIRVVAIKAGIV